jgi:hypothetical protein
MRKTLLLPIVALMTIIALSVPFAEAEVYSGSATVGWVVPECSLSVAIDTDTNTWTFHYYGPPAIILPMPGGWFFAAYSVWDDNGYSHSDVFTKPSGTVTFTDFTDRGTWTHTYVHWCYVGADYIWDVPARVDIYIPSQAQYIPPNPVQPLSTGGGGGGGRLPMPI